jgi:hypothetical protein
MDSKLILETARGTLDGIGVLQIFDTKQMRLVSIH